MIVEPYIQNVPHGFNDGFLKRYPNIRAESSSEHNELLVNKGQIRRLTPIECERLQGFPDGWTENGLQQVHFCGIIEERLLRSGLCDKNVELKNAIDRLFQENLGYALCTTSDSKGGELQINISDLELEKGLNAQYVVGQFCLTEQKDIVQDITNLGSDMVTLCSLTDKLRNEEEIRKNLIQDKMARESTSLLWKICLEESYNPKRLSTILIWIKEIMKHQIFTYTQTDESTIKGIILWNYSPRHYSNERLFTLKMANTIFISDTQRYKCLGNAVTVNVIEAIGRQMVMEIK